MTDAPRKIVVLGSTGSIGEQTLDVAASFPESLLIYGLAANRNVGRLMEQAERFRPKRIALADDRVNAPLSIPRGEAALVEMVTDPQVDLVVVAVVGAAGLAPTLAALSAGKCVALANKETLVMAGDVIRDQLTRSGTLVPIDSEHSAIWQCLQGESTIAVEKLLLTASGGAFRDFTPDELGRVTPEQALRHPTWTMGPKVTIDSATLMNKGLEIIEATILFDVAMDEVDVIMHRESIVHSLVYFNDSSVKAHLGLPDMRIPIQYALTHPARWPVSLERLDLTALGALHFAAVPRGRYPCLELCLEAGRQGGTYPAALCAADDIAVELFLQGAIPFTSIPNLVSRTLDSHESHSNPELVDILEADASARRTCYELARGVAA